MGWTPPVAAPLVAAASPWALAFQSAARTPCAAGTWLHLRPPGAAVGSGPLMSCIASGLATHARRAPRGMPSESPDDDEACPQTCAW